MSVTLLHVCVLLFTPTNPSSCFPNTVYPYWELGWIKGMVVFSVEDNKGGISSPHNLPGYIARVRGVGRVAVNYT